MSYIFLLIMPKDGVSRCQGCQDVKKEVEKLEITTWDIFVEVYQSGVALMCNVSPIMVSASEAGVSKYNNQYIG